MSSHQSYRSLLRFTIPSMGMMVLTSAYGIVDGFFVSNYAGKTAFAALNLVWPIVLILGTIGFMLGIGGNAVVSRTRGEGDEQRARSYFSLIVYATIVLGVLFAVVGLASLRPLLGLMGIEGQLLELGATYGTVLFAALPALILQYAFQSLSTTAGRPDFGFAVTVAAGLTNVVLDALFIAVFGWGLAGAAAATAASMAVGGGRTRASSGWADRRTSGRCSGSRRSTGFPR